MWAIPIHVQNGNDPVVAVIPESGNLDQATWEGASYRVIYDAFVLGKMDNVQIIFKFQNSYSTEGLSGDDLIAAESYLQRLQKLIELLVAGEPPIVDANVGRNAWILPQRVLEQ